MTDLLLMSFNQLQVPLQTSSCLNHFCHFILNESQVYAKISTKLYEKPVHVIWEA